MQQLGGTDQRQWKLVKDDSGIRVFQAPVRGSEYDEYKLETVVDATLSALVALNSDIYHLPNWVETLESVHHISGSEQRYVSHSKTKMPWPVKNRDAVVETWIEQHPETLQVLMNFHSRDNIVPHLSGYERVKLLRGQWILTPQKKALTHVEYRSHAEAGGKIPGWISNMFGVDVPLKAMKNMVRELQLERYRSAVKGFIREPFEGEHAVPEDVQQLSPLEVTT